MARNQVKKLKMSFNKTAEPFRMKLVEISQNGTVVIKFN
jgi:hypothetical protein